MIIVRFFKNLMIMAIELALIAGVAWGAWQYPLMFAVATGMIGFVLGLGLERARLANEIGFYLGGLARPLSVFTSTVALGEAAVKGVLAGVAALLTFSGTDAHRLGLIAALFGVCLFAGTSLLRRLRISFGVRAERWGYFRLAPPLGLVFSAGVALLVASRQLPAASLSDLTKRLFLDTPRRPSISQASELLFLFKQYFDEVIASLLSLVLGEQGAAVAGVLLSVNMLTGFVVAIYAVLIAKLVQVLEGDG